MIDYILVLVAIITAISLVVLVSMDVYKMWKEYFKDE